MQITAYEKPVRDLRPAAERSEVALGLLPLSHIYGLVVIAQASTYRGDGVIILPKFELRSYLRAIEVNKIRALYLVRASQFKYIMNQKLIRNRFLRLLSK
jgi:ribosome assembly protein SQT1